MRIITTEDLVSNSNPLLSDVVLDNVKEMRGVEVRLKIDDLMTLRGMSQKELSIVTGIRLGTISDMVNGKSQSFHFVRMLAIMNALRVTNINQVVEIVVDRGLADEYAEQTAEWVSTKEKPESVVESYKKNLLKQFDL